MSGRTWTWKVTPTGAPATLPVLDGSITVDATRNPQVQAQLTVPFTSWTEAKRFDPYERSEVYLEVRYGAYATGTLSTFGQGTTPGTLATLDWSNKQQNPSWMGGPTVSTSRTTRRLRLYVTEVTADETNDTLDVTLASADYLLTELVNFGPDWTPRAGGMLGTTPRYSLDDVWNEFFRVFGLPLWLSDFLADPTTGYAWRSDVEPWKTGANAWSWLNDVRTEVPGWRYVINTETGQVSFLQNFGDVSAPAAIRTGATAVTTSRSVSNAGEGMNQYADAVAIQWTDRTTQNRGTQWEFANKYGDWRGMRRPYIEQRDMPTSGASPVLAEARLATKQKFQRMVTITRPIDALTAPFRDLSDHAYRTSIQSMTYNYVAADVTTTYLESDA